MSASDVQILVIVLVGLFAWCALYARVLALHPQWYLPNNKTWVTVLFGFLWILIALAILVSYGIFGLADFGIVILCCSAAGAPIVIWQYIQDARQRATLHATQNNRRGEDGTED